MKDIQMLQKEEDGKFGSIFWQNRWNWAYSETQHGLRRQACCNETPPKFRSCLACTIHKSQNPGRDQGGPNFLRQAQLQKLEAQLSDSLKMNLRHLDWQNSVVSQSPPCWCFEKAQKSWRTWLAMTCHSFWPIYSRCSRLAVAVTEVGSKVSLFQMLLVLWWMRGCHTT